MHDYISYFNDKKPSDKRGVGIKRDIDWWMEYLASRMAKLLFLVLLAVLCLVVKSMWQVGKSESAFPIARVALTGDVIITQPKDIQQSLAAIGQGSFFDLDIQKISDSIEELPWVEKATVSRQWPDGLSIDLVERQAKYRWGANELVDSEGNRFAKINIDKFMNLPQLGGVDGHESEVIFAYQQLLGELGSRASDLEIASFVLNRYLSWELHLQSGLVVKFGRDNYQRRLTRFVDAYHQGKLPSFGKLDFIDLRYQRGFSVKWKPEFAPEVLKNPMLKVSTKQI